jgi:hypothetical protein
LIAYVSGKAPESEMPPNAVQDKFLALSPDEVALLRAWIDQGPVAGGRVAHSAKN